MSMSIFYLYGILTKIHYLMNVYYTFLFKILQHEYRKIQNLQPFKNFILVESILFILNISLIF